MHRSIRLPIMRLRAFNITLFLALGVITVIILSPYNLHLAGSQLSFRHVPYKPPNISVTPGQRGPTKSYTYEPPKVSSKSWSSRQDQKAHLNVRVIIIVMTMPENLDTKATAVRETWAKRADKVIYLSSKSNNSFPTVGTNMPEGWKHLTEKTWWGFRYLYEHHRDDADWFMKADDDTYIIVENLKYFLSSQNASDPIYFGHLFNSYLKQGYNSGGAGYVLSKEALKRLYTKGKDPKICQPKGDFEDVEMGRCMEGLGVETANTTDAHGRSRFHCFAPQTHIGGNYVWWYYKWVGGQKGPASMSDHTISFHDATPELMRTLDWLIYNLQPYGVESVRQELNAHHPNRLLEQTEVAYEKGSVSTTRPSPQTLGAVMVWGAVWLAL